MRSVLITPVSFGYTVRCIPADDEGMEMTPRRTLTRRGALRVARRWMAA